MYVGFVVIFVSFIVVIATCSSKEIDPDIQDLHMQKNSSIISIDSDDYATDSSLISGFRMISDDTSGTLHCYDSTYAYYYLDDTSVVYIGVQGVYSKTFTPVISSNGYFLMYDDEAQRVSEIRN
jgi:hypothetical protein